MQGDIYVLEVKVILWSLSKVTHISLISNSFCLEATGQTEVSLPTEPSWDKGTQIYQNKCGHMTKMANMSICGKIFKIFSRTEQPMILKVLKHYQIPSNDDSRLTFDLFMQMSSLVPYAFLWENA